MRYGFSLLNRWANGDDPWKDADWSASWKLQTVSEREWADLQQQLDARTQQVAALEAQAKQAQQDVADTAAKLSDDKAQLDQATQQREALQTQLAATQSELEQATQQRTAAQDQLEASEKRMKRRNQLKSELYSKRLRSRADQTTVPMVAKANRQATEIQSKVRSPLPVSEYKSGCLMAKI